ncbi:hypothetical protein [Pedobacter punctiformis]|uniref:DUF4595 domain-containing protein n=1 Tax=Pedobacter punctiformis TaxID=3004097 RepID=A0ABT4L8K2_9SPHI|nr:hypothetical protein [Pedobacter sp. HCMS5-2]MCZ4244261.1 hypothetical protein [Pedobacter sp. HCMS5-2]
MKKNRLIYGIISMLLMISCRNEIKKNTQNNVRDTISRTNPNIEKGSIANKMMENAVPAALYSVKNARDETIGIHAAEASAHSRYFLVGDTNFITASRYIKSDGQYRQIKTDTLLANEYTYTELDSNHFVKKKINNKDYVLLTVKETFKGQAVTSIDLNFIMLDLNSMEYYTLRYVGEHSLRCYDCIDGSFTENKQLDKYPDIKKALYQYANESKWVYRPAAAEKSPDYYKNYEVKWDKDNQADYHLANGHSDIPETIYSTYYKEDLFKITGDRATATTIENSRFIIASYFRGNILGYDKQKKLYFPIYIESCVTGCDKKIKFTSGNAIEAKYDEYSANKVYTINLDEIKFK